MNKEANKLFGTTATCPCCSTYIETFGHIFRCQAEATVSFHQSAQTKLETELSTIKTSEKLITSILHGIDSWVPLPEDELPVSLYRGSVLPEDVTIAHAFQKQNIIGWEQLLHGRISKLWSLAYQTGSKSGMNTQTEPWANNLVGVLW